MFWSAGSDGCAFYRCHLPAAELARRGHETHVAYVWCDSFVGKGEGWLKPDVLVGQRVTNPGPTETWRTACRDPDIHTVFELDDDLLNIDPSNSVAYEFFGRPDNRARLIGNIAMADAVTVSTPPLAEAIRPINKNVYVVPNTMPDAVMNLDPGYVGFDIGWHGSSTHNMDWDFAADQIKRWLKRNSDRNMLMIGADYGSAWGLPNYQHKDWVSPVPALWDAFNFRIGVAPLRPHRFNRSKSHIKALEYASRGIPTIATFAEPYQDFIQHGVNGALIRRDHEWGEWLRALTENPEIRQELGLNAFKRARQFTTEEWGGKWCEAYGITPRATLGV
jgi:glycosyltransferase involved in cell wall biosynthesis